MANPLDPDTCIYVEAVSGDGGNHTAPVWWLSPDIDLVAPVPGIAQAPPATNQVRVQVHKAEGCSLSASTQVKAEAWVCSPSWGVAPGPSHKIGTALYTIGVLSAAPTARTLNWTLPSPPPTNVQDPQAQGHRCLVVRAWPTGVTPSTTDFFLPGDRHAAQHNICVIQCVDAPAPPAPGGGAGQPLPPGQDGFWEFPLLLTNFDVKRPAQYLLQAVFDPGPEDKAVLATVIPRLRKLHVGVASDRRPPTGLRVKGMPNLPVKRTRRGFQATVKLGPKRTVETLFRIRMPRGVQNRAFIFHLTQALLPDRQGVGGITLAFFRRG